MLSEKQQRLLADIYVKYVTSNSKTVTFTDVKEIYNSIKSFKVAMKYLEQSNLIEITNLDYHSPVYSLTVVGEMLARILCNLIDQPEKNRKLEWKMFW